jgi:mono/diheme cytochrome c family protein
MPIGNDAKAQTALRDAVRRQFIGGLSVKNRTGLVCLVLTLSLQTLAWGADAEDGERLARRVCSTCHSIAAGQSPMADAPPFASIARSRSFRKEGSGLLLKSHVKMPNFAFTNEQADNVVAYLKTLARRRVPY